MTILSYRGTDRPANEANIVRIDQRSLLSPRGKRMQKEITFYVQGEIIGTGSTLLDSCQAFLVQFNDDYGDLVLKMDDGTVTPHRLINGQSVSGVRIVHRSWSKGAPEELATTRTYSFVARAILDDCEDSLLNYTERFRYVGNCGPRFDYVETFQGPFFFLTALATAQRIMQSGVAVGYVTNPAPPGAIFPQWEHQDQREIEYDAGREIGQGTRLFETRWSYRMTSDVPLNAI